jgi:outer membrane protein OmpA-like peptidoglycan-associated protein
MIRVRLTPLRRFSRAVALVGFVSAAEAQSLTCATHENEMTAAYAARDGAAASRIVRAATGEGVCQGPALSLLGRNAALTALAEAYASSSDAPGARLSRLSAALTQGRPWQLLASLGDLHTGRKDHSQAAALFQEALDDIRDETLNPKSPPLDVIKSIFKKAETARLLASTYVRRTDRSGMATGLACTRYRDLSVERVAVPIEFKYNATSFTEKGRSAVEDLHKVLTEQGAPAILLVGHTDPIGGEAFNHKLSEDRAAAVKTFLVQRGYVTAKITTAGRGKTQPFLASDPSALTKDEQHQLDRRVELERPSGATCGS